MPSASRTIPRRGSAPDLLSVWAEDEPGGAEVVNGLSGGISGIVIGDDVVQRVARVRHLDRAVGAVGGAEERSAGAAARLRGAVGEERWPVRRARAVARGGRALVGLEEVERPPAAVDQDLAE